MTYCSSAEVLNYLGKDAKTKVRSEAVGTGDGTTIEFSLNKDNVISGSDNVSYIDGDLIFTSSGTTYDGIWNIAGTFSGENYYTGSNQMITASQKTIFYDSSSSQWYLGDSTGSAALWYSTGSTIYGGWTDLAMTGSATVGIGDYSIDLDDGIINFSSAPCSGCTITADYDYSDIADSVVQQMISSSDNLLETELGRTFESSSTIEYLNVEQSQKVFFIQNYPVLDLTSVERNTSTQQDEPVWETLSAGMGNDYLTNSSDLASGRIRFIDNFPYVGQDMLKVQYSYGYDSTPAMVKELSILLTLRQMVNSTVYKSIFEGYDNFTPVRLNEINERIEELKKVLKKQSVEAV